MPSETFAEVALLLRGYQIAQLLHIAAKLRLADRVEGGARPVAELAAETGANADMLLRLCRALCAFGIFALDEANRLSQTAQSACLRSDATPTLHHAACYWGLPSNWSAWGDLRHTIITGEPAFEKCFGVPYFDYLAANPEQGEIFDAYMRHSPDDRHRAVAAAYDFSGASVVVDVGGGNGGLLRAILDAYGNVSGILADQAGVVAAAAPVLGPQAGRCAIVATDFFVAVPAGGDIYTMAQVLHDWSDENCLRILANCRAAMKPDARLLVIERHLDPGSKSAAMNFLSDMHMMALFPGAQERTAGEYGRLFRASRLREPVVIPTNSPFGIFETGPA